MGVTTKPDFTGWATKSGLQCSDGRTIGESAFKHQDKIEVPLVWQHMHDEPENILGKVILHSMPEGVRVEAFFNDTDKASIAKKIVKHGDIKFLSIFANQLRETRGAIREVTHGMIREVSLVLAGANPGAVIDNLAIRHADGEIEYRDAEVTITTGLEIDVEELSHADGEDAETIQDILDGMSPKERDVVMHMLQMALETNIDDVVQHSDTDSVNTNDGDDATDGDDSEDDASTDADADQTDDGANAGDDNNPEGNLEHQEGTDMNVFDQNNSGGGTATQGPTLSHGALMEIVADAKQNGSLQDAFKAYLGTHAEELKHSLGDNPGDPYGITNIELLFPEAKGDVTPQLITRQMEWVSTVLNGTRKLPYAKIKSMSADVTHEEARANGYIKGDMKKNEFFALAGRETGPKTIYKKQQLDRDDIIDITDFDVVTWLWAEMRIMLNEEIARAILIGDGREVDDPFKVDEDKIRPIASDHEFYTDVVVVPTNVGGEDLVEMVIRERESYKGVGNPTAFMSTKVMNDMLLLKDKMNRRLYRNRAELAAELEVSSIVNVPVMEGHQLDDGELLILLVNLSDYSVGTNKGGQITTFDDFDIKYNQYQYLIEGRMSGALTKHKTAQVFVRTNGTSVTPTVPTFNATTGVLTIPNTTGVVYKNGDTGTTFTAGAQTAIAAGATVEVEATPATGYYFPHNIDADWEFTRNSA